MGPFELTSISPTVVSTAGGTRVTITGNAIPAGATVRIGDSTPVRVVKSTSTSLTFTTPRLIEGTYDVHVFSPDGRTSVLDDGLTFVDAADGGDGGGNPPDDGTPDPGDGIGPGLPPDPDEGQEPDDTPEQVVTAPGGQRLVSSALFSSLSPTIWNLDCTASCSGLPL